MDSSIEFASGALAGDTLIQPVILTGGAGTRLWPLSRKAMPKPLLPLLSERTMLQQTVARTAGHAGFGAPVIVCSNEHCNLVTAQLAEMGVSPRAVLAEPVGRNTAPALAVAALVLAESDPDAVMLVQPSDHLIGDEAALRRTVASAAAAAAQGWIVTFGLAPGRPETGYGYIRPGAPLDSAAGVHRVRSFIEKPSREVAEELIRGGDAMWNSGMFLMSARRYLEELEALRPDIVRCCREAIAAAAQSADGMMLDQRAFEAAAAISIDRAVMEHTARAAVVRLETHWNDVGSWRSLRDEGRPDKNGNVVVGEAMLEDVRNCYIRSEDGLVAAVGLDDTIVVSTADAVLVASADQAAKVGRIAERLNGDGRRETARRHSVIRPWGQFETLSVGPRHQVKQIVVRPGARLSLQFHHHRSEHWIVVAGTARVVCGDRETTVHENQTVYIPAGTRHRLENPGKIPLRVIEVQYGSYLGEDDIVRIDDLYGRS